MDGKVRTDVNFPAGFMGKTLVVCCVKAYSKTHGVGGGGVGAVTGKRWILQSGLLIFGGMCVCVSHVTDWLDRYHAIYSRLPVVTSDGMIVPSLSLSFISPGFPFAFFVSLYSSFFSKDSTKIL